MVGVGIVKVLLRVVSPAGGRQRSKQPGGGKDMAESTSRQREQGARHYEAKSWRKWKEAQTNENVWNCSVVTGNPTV